MSSLVLILVSLSPKRTFKVFWTAVVVVDDMDYAGNSGGVGDYGGGGKFSQEMYPSMETSSLVR